MAINSLSRDNRRFPRDFKLTTSQTLAKLKRTTRMSSPIARILHFSFETAEDLELWVFKHETETIELAKEAIQRTLIKTDETYW